MPRRHYYRRTVRPKQKWAINMVDCLVSATTTVSLDAGHAAVFKSTVCKNSTRIENSGAAVVSSAQILKTGMFKFKGVIPNVAANVNYLIYICYVPEGYPLENNLRNNDGDDLFYRHPEWVIAWTRKDYTSIEQSNEVTLTSRLKRNLNTGDEIQVRIIFYSPSSINLNSGTPLLRGTASYCCRAN